MTPPPGRPPGPVEADVPPARRELVTGLRTFKPKGTKNKEIARAASISESRISLFLRGREVPTWPNLERIVDFLRNGWPDSGSSPPFPTRDQWYDLYRAAAEEAGQPPAPKGDGRPRQGRPAADGIVARAAALLVPGRDLRTVSPDDRRQLRHDATALTAELRARPEGTLRGDGLHTVLENVAAHAEALIADRDPLAAAALTRAVLPHLDPRSGHPGPEVLRAHAEALSELGHHDAAVDLLLRLTARERSRPYGHAHPRSLMLLHWARAGQGRLVDARNGLSRLESRLAGSGESGAHTLAHVRCRNSYVVGRLGGEDESEGGYTRVISSRARSLSENHPDLLDARHSLGKVHVLAGRGEQALAALWFLPELRARIQGDTHPDVLESLKYRLVAQALVEPRDDRVVGDAIRGLEEILRMQREWPSPVHPMILDTNRRLRRLHAIRDAKGLER